MAALHQSKLFTKKNFIIKESGLHVQNKDLTSSFEVEIPFEEITARKIMTQKKSEILLLILTLLFSIIFIANFGMKVLGDPEITWGTVLILFAFPCLCGLLTYVRRIHSYFIPTINNGLLEIFYGKPTKEDAEKFINTLKLSINSYLKIKYGKIDMELPIDPQLSNLMWLRDRDIINEKEFEDLKNQLYGKRTLNSPIGFKN